MRHTCFRGLCGGLVSTLVTLLLVFCLLFPATSAHSRQRNPLRSIARVEDVVVHTAGQRVHALSSFRISLTLRQLDAGRRRRLPLRLHLRPNHDVLAADAAIHRRNADGSVTVEPIRRLDHRVFRGDVFVLADGTDNQWINAGWASVYVHADGARPVFEGAFRIFGDDHHVQTREHYEATRVWGDPLVPIEGGEYGADYSYDYGNMVAWRDSDVLADAAALPSELRRRWQAEDRGDVQVCSADGLLHNQRGLGGGGADEDAPWLFGRQIDGSSTGGNSAGVNLTTTIGNTVGCPTTRKVALMGIAADCTYAGAFSGRENATSNIVQQIGAASQVYESTFNVSLAIKSLVMENDTCPGSAAAAAQTAAAWNADCSSGLTINDRLNLFSAWRGTQNDTNAFWMLLSTCATDAAVGLAWLGQLCLEGTSSETGSNETVAAANVVVLTSTEWQVMAHETGHTFGAVHDCTSTTCADGTAARQQCCPLSAETCDAGGQFIMNPSTGSAITEFSACTVGNVCSALGRNSVDASCLSDNRDVSTYSNSSVCGNGIVEPGEDCDCGGDAGCASGSASCCDPDTCLFTAGAVCDPANDACCTVTCQVAGAGTVCRRSTGACDPAETCDGTSTACPTDATTDDGTACSNANGTSGLACASGQCTSRDLQCQDLLGSSSSACDSDSGCSLSCATTSSSASFFGGEMCVLMLQNFLDGTPCASGSGHCSNGQCVDVNVGNEIVSALRSNLHIVIPVAAVVGFLLLVALAGCLMTFLRRRRWQRQRRLYQEQQRALREAQRAARHAARHGGAAGAAAAAAAIPMTSASGWSSRSAGPKPAGAASPASPRKPGWAFWKKTRADGSGSDSVSTSQNVPISSSPAPPPPPPSVPVDDPPPYSPPQHPVGRYA